MSRLLMGCVISLLVGCPTGDGTTDKDSETTGNTDQVTTAVPTGDTGPDEPEGIDPVAVGFELYAQLGPAGSLEVWSDGDGTFIPLVIITFADLEYFYGNTEGHSCSTVAYFGTDEAYGGILPKTKPDQVPTFDGAVLYWSYEVALDVLTDPDDTDCDELVDPKLWGENAELLLEPFDGARFGLGFGPMTDYLREYWESLDADVLNDISPGFLAEYIAINDKDGDWLAEDWTTAILWETDVYGDPVVDADDYLTAVPVDGLVAGADLPTGQIRSYAYWFQDFPLMDLSNLRDGAP